MALFDIQQDVLVEEGLDSTRKNPSTNKDLSKNKDIILCNHCKRTASNGIRCLGMCIADNDYQNSLKVYLKEAENKFRLFLEKLEVLINRK